MGSLAPLNERRCAKREPERLALVPSGAILEPWNSPYVDTPPRADDRGEVGGETRALPAGLSPARRRGRLHPAEALSAAAEEISAGSSPALSLSGCGARTAGFVVRAARGRRSAADDAVAGPVEGGCPSEGDDAATVRINLRCPQSQGYDRTPPPRRALRQ